MTLTDIAKTLDATVLSGQNRMESAIEHVCACDLMSDVLAFITPGGLLLTGLTNPQVIRTAEMAEINGVCFVRGKQPPTETVTLAVEKNVPILTTDYSMYEACGRLHKEGLSGC